MSKPIARVAMLSAIAFVVYGAWAAFANREYASSVIVRAFVVQGVSSALSTASISSVIELFWQRLGGGKHSVFVAATAACLVAAAFHATLHLIGGTPNVAAAIAVPTLMGFVFGLAYALTLVRAKSA